MMIGTEGACGRLLYVTFDLQIGRIPRLGGEVGGEASVIAGMRGG